MIVTVEPGCYFNPFLLEPAFKNPAQAKYLNEGKLRECMVCLAVVIEYCACNVIKCSVHSSDVIYLSG